MTVFEHKVGDRVTREKYFNDRVSLRRGTVVEVYADTPSHIGTKNALYAVRWDDTELIERGYMYGGLTPTGEKEVIDASYGVKGD